MLVNSLKWDTLYIVSVFINTFIDILNIIVDINIIDIYYRYKYIYLTYLFKFK